MKIPEIAYKQKKKITVPHKFMMNTELTSSEKFLFLGLCFFVQGNTTRVPSMYLAELTGIARSMVSNYLKKLEQKGYIMRKGREKGRTIVLTKKGMNIIGRKLTK